MRNTNKRSEHDDGEELGDDATTIRSVTVAVNIPSLSRYCDNGFLLMPITDGWLHVIHKMLLYLPRLLNCLLSDRGIRVQL